MDFDEQLIAEAALPVEAGDTGKTVVQKIGDMVEEVMACAGDRRVLGIGIAVPGPVDKSQGRTTEYRYIRAFQHIPLRDLMEARFHIPVVMENTVNAMALAELWFGAGRALDHFICLGVRTGVGAGIVINGSLYSGPDDAAGEIGFMACPVQIKGRLVLRELQEVYEPTHLPMPHIEASTLGDYAGAWGAAALVVDQWKPER